MRKPIEWNEGTVMCPSCEGHGGHSHGYSEYYDDWSPCSDCSETGLVSTEIAYKLIRTYVCNISVERAKDRWQRANRTEGMRWVDEQVAAYKPEIGKDGLRKRFLRTVWAEYFQNPLLKARRDFRERAWQRWQTAHPQPNFESLALDESVLASCLPAFQKEAEDFRTYALAHNEFLEREEIFRRQSLQEMKDEATHRSKMWKICFAFTALVFLTRFSIPHGGITP
jgi:hypothetical protein